MKNKFITSGILSAFLLYFLYSCTKDFIEPDLSNKSISIILPQDNAISNVATQSFRWDSLPGARTYNIQIVTPSFANIKQYILDTSVTKPIFVYLLQPGKSYQWRIRAQNSFSKTVYQIFNLRIDSTSDLSSQVVFFTFPSTNNYYSNSALNRFQWLPLYNAVDYRFQIINQAGNTLIADTAETATTYKATLPQGTYTVQVRAQNNSSNSGYTSRIFTVALSPPNPSIPQSPPYGSSHTRVDTLRWLTSTGRIADSLFIDTDSLFTRPHTIDFRTSGTSYIFSTGLSGSLYYWRLKSVDAAGNWSTYSSKSTFRIN